MAIDPEQVRRIARLARLELEPADVERFARQLGSVLDHMTVLDELSLDGEESQERDSETELKSCREDRVREGLAADEAVRDAPDPVSGFFRVPRSLPE